MAAAVSVVVGCGDPVGIKAQFNNIEGKPIVYAMNGPAITLPAAIQFRSLSTARIDSRFIFDVAFDIDAAGVVQVYAMSRVANELVATHRVGMQISGVGFAAMLKAPSSGYAYDTVMALPVGQTMLIDVLDASCTSSFLGANIRAKMKVDSINVATRAVFLHILSDPNCGFRALNQGEPKD